MAMPSGMQAVVAAVTVPHDRSQPGSVGVAAALLLSLGLSVGFVYIPWELISAGGFPDRDNYLQAIDTLMASGAQPFDFSGADLLALFLNEYLWREVLIILGTYFEHPLEGFLVVSVITCTLLTFHVIRRAGILYAFLFLLSPLTVDLIISQTRSALAFAVFLFALTVRGRLSKYGLLIGAFLIHTFGAILFALYHFSAFVLARRQLGTRQKLIAVAIGGLIASAVLAFIAEIILMTIGDRRAFQMALLPSSVAFAVWWMVLTAMLVAFARLWTRPGNGQFVLAAVFLQATFVFSTLFSAGALRFLSLSLPVACVAIRSFPNRALRVGAAAGTLAFNLILFAFYWMA